MTDIPEWAKQRACDAVGISFDSYKGGRYFDVSLKAINFAASLIAEHEEPPVDAVLQHARDFVAEQYLALDDRDEQHKKSWANFCRQGIYDSQPRVVTALAAIRRGIELGKGSAA
jgi:hypothetical protein